MAITELQRFIEEDADELVNRMTMKETCSLLAGKNWWETVPIPRVGIPGIKMSDGPNGVRGASHFRPVPAQCIPCATALASTWNTVTAVKVGTFLAAETLRKGSSILLAPTVNIQRSPLGGRAFESFSEDPLLSGVLASSYIIGLQSSGVGATIKHFVANDMEHERNAVNSEMDERTFREIYLKPFEIAQRLSKPWAFMTSYGRVEGVHCSENRRLLEDILRGEWGFDGIVMSDWFGTYSTTEAVNAGLDLEMPGPASFRGGLLEKSINAQKVLPHVIRERAKAMIKVIQKAAKSHPECMVRFPEVSKSPSEEDRLANREFAKEAIVLLKNDGDLLPINAQALRKVAVIGPNAKARVISGGGSAALAPQYVITPFEGIKSSLPSNVELSYEVGCHSHRYLPLLDGLLKTGPEPSSPEGYFADFYNGSLPVEGARSPKLMQVQMRETRVRLNDNLPDGLDMSNFSISAHGYFTPERDGIYMFGICVVGRAKIIVDGKIIVDLWEDQTPGESFYGKGTSEIVGEISLKAGIPYLVNVVYNSIPPQSMAGVAVPGLMSAAFRLGCVQKIDPQQAIKDAVAAAIAADIAILVVGNNMDWESEGADRKTLDLPGLTNELIAAVAKAQPRLVVVNQSGSAVAMPWATEVPSILQAWFGGCENGNAIADVLFGRHNPSGKLPITFPRREQDIPAYGSFRSENGNVRYQEGLFVGYRWYDARHVTPLFPFGHGLSYTTFSYSSLFIKKGLTVFEDENDSVAVSVQVANIGKVAGSEVVQFYVGRSNSSLIRAEKELKGFAKVKLEPGESKEAVVLLDRTAFAFYNDRRARWEIEPGQFNVLVGTSSTNIVLEDVFSISLGSFW